MSGDNSSTLQSSHSVQTLQTTRQGTLLREDELGEISLKERRLHSAIHRAEAVSYQQIIADRRRHEIEKNEELFIEVPVPGVRLQLSGHFVHDPDLNQTDRVLSLIVVY